jgi:hypothetical protein
MQFFSSRVSISSTPWNLLSLALLTYLTSSVLEDTTAVLALGPDASEELHVARCNFLVQLSRIRGAAPVPPMELRALLEESAHCHPSNRAILLA